MRPKLTTVCPTAFPHSGWPHPTDIKNLRQTFLKLTTDGAAMNLPKFLCLSRQGQPRAQGNEILLHNEVSARGFFHFRPEEFDFLEQVSIFANASIVIGLHGCAFVNTTFLARGSRVLELMRSNYANPCFETLASEVGASYSRQIHAFPHLRLHRLTSALDEL